MPHTTWTTIGIASLLVIQKLDCYSSHSLRTVSPFTCRVGHREVGRRTCPPGGTTVARARDGEDRKAGDPRRPVKARGPPASAYAAGRRGREEEATSA